MHIPSIQFLGSFPNYAACPVTRLPEFAFIGRSNVGKSSLINTLTGIKELARTSSTPGKTLLINCFRHAKNYLMVDLPGYGFARISKTERERIRKMVNNYLRQSAHLQCVFLLIDIRIPRQEADKVFMEWLATEGIPFALVFTKADKLKRVQIKKCLENYKLSMEEEWTELPPVFVTSSRSGEGRDGLMEYMESLLPAPPSS